MTVRFSVTVRQVREDGTEVPVEGELAAALAGPAEQFAGLASWAAEEARFLDHGEREDVIGQEGRELQRRLLQATFAIDSAREERLVRRFPGCAADGHRATGSPPRSSCRTARASRVPARSRT